MKVFIFFLLPLLVSKSFSQTSNIANYSSETNDRFAGSSQFVGSNLDFSGVGRTSRGRWATLIAPNIFVSANHFAPAIGQQVTFYAENDSSGPSFSYQVTGTSRIEGSDLRIGHFDAPVDSSVSFYNWQSEELDRDTFASSSLSNAAILQLSRSANFGPLTDLTVGQNVISSFLSDAYIPGLGAGDFVTTRYSLSDDQVQHHEALLSNGDSGSPLFVANGDELSVIGVGSAKTSAYSYFAYTGTSSDAVENYIQLNGIAVPEPSCCLLLGLGLVGIWMRRR